MPNDQHQSLVQQLKWQLLDSLSPWPLSCGRDVAWERGNFSTTQTGHEKLDSG